MFLPVLKRRSVKHAPESRVESLTGAEARHQTDFLHRIAGIARLRQAPAGITQAIVIHKSVIVVPRMAGNGRRDVSRRRP